MTAARIANDVVRFALELTALLALAAGGAQLAGGPARWVLAVAVPTAGALYWGRWVAPKSTHRLQDPQRLAAELAFFAVGAMGALSAHSAAVASAFLVVATINALLVRLPMPAGVPWR